MPSEDPTQSQSGSPAVTGTRPLLAWLPLGLLAAALVAFGRLSGRLSASGRGLEDMSPQEESLLAWELAHGFLPDFVPALVLALLAASLINQAARTRARAGGRAPQFLFGALVLLSGLSGWPLAAEAHRASTLGSLAADDLATCAAAAFALAALLYLGSRAERDGSPVRVLFSGPLGLALALAGVLAPLYWMWAAAVEPPRFQQREVARDLLVSLESFEPLQINPAAPPRLGVLTPDVQNKTDSADKPALILTPPARVRFQVEAENGPFVLRAAAGLNKPIRHWLQTNGRTRCSVDFLVRVDGELVFEERVVSQVEWDPARLDEGAMVWHHVGGADGLALESGALVELETRIPPGDPAEAIPHEVLEAGFGTLVLERARTIPRSVARPDKPNLILIVMDTLRADRMSCYGYPKPTTPNLDALAERGILFENASSTASWTWPATASILTGLPAEEHGVVSNESCTLALDLQSVAEPLQYRGFTTAAFSCNPLIAPERYFDQGFEFFDHDSASFRMSDEVMPDVMRWLRGHRGARFFLYLHLADPHTPHRPHPAELARLGGERPEDFPQPVGPKGEQGDGMDHYTGVLNRLAQQPGTTPEQLRAAVPEEHRRWIQEQYDASVATGDRWLGVLFRELERLGLGENTILAFTSDHGEELFDHDLLEHGHTLYSELVQVPLILAGPGIPHGLRNKDVVSNRHLGPTLARLGGGSLPRVEEAGFDFLLDESLSGRAIFHTAKGLWGKTPRQNLFGLREGPWVLHWREDDEPDLGDVRLFNVEADPGQELELARQELTIVKEMQQALEDEILEQRAKAPTHRIGAGASGMEMLRGIGYAGEDEDEDEEAGSGAERSIRDEGARGTGASQADEDR